MADHSTIEWTDATWSIVTGCTRTSDGCAHCYIERTPPFRMAHRRFDGPGDGATTGVLLHPERLTIPLHWRKRRKVFVCSMADLFHDQVPDDYIARVFAVMQSCAAHTFQVLTKRHGRMRALLNSEKFWSAVTDFGYIVMAQRPSREQHWPDHGQRCGFLPNVWLGVSAEDARWAKIRVDALRDVPAAVRFVSCEPLLGPIDDLDLTGIGWVIVGGESGPGARPMHPGWARCLRDQCVAADVPFFFKQWGAWAPGYSHGAGEKGRGDAFVNLDGATGHVWIDEDSETVSNWCGNWGEDSYPMSRVGKKRAGRELDGRRWDEYPEVVMV